MIQHLIKNFSISGVVLIQKTEIQHYQGTADTARIQADITQSHQDTSPKYKLKVHGYSGDATLSTQNHITLSEAIDLKDFKSINVFNLD